MKNDIRQTMNRIAAAVICILCIFNICPDYTFAAELPKERVIRVGSPETIYDDVNANGDRSGYGYEYLQKIANYTGWRYEYVPCTWNDCFEKLQNGEIDILEAISYTDERAKTMAFSDMPISEEKYYIFAELGDTDLSVSDISKFNGRNIGVLKDHLPEIALNEWTEKNHLSMNKLNITTKEQTIERMLKHETDCFVSVEASYWGEYGMAPIVTIGSSGIYFTFRKDSTELKANVDSAMLRISEEYPFFANDLYKEYFSDTRIPVLTKEERTWINEHGAIHVGYRMDDGAVSTFHPDTGAVSGVIADFIRLSRNCLHDQELHFEPVGFDSRAAMSEALHNGEIDMIFYVTQNLNSAESLGYDLSETTWTSSMAVVTVKDYIDLGEETTVAVINGKSALRAYISKNFPKWKFVEYGSEKEAIKAVRRGRTDCIVVNSEDAMNYTKNSKLRSFILSEPNNAAFAVEHGNIVLLSILNKILDTTSVSKISGLLSMHNNELRKVTLSDFVWDNLIIVSVLTALIFIVMLCLLRDAMHAKKKATEAQKQAEAANRAKTTFLNNMSHDIRTPINGIIGMLRIIENSKNDPERMEDCLKKIDSSSRLLLSLVNDVLDLAKLESDERVMKNESVNLCHLCDDIGNAVYFQAEAAGITLTEEHDDYAGVYVFTNSVYLKKVLVNLFTNAVKYNKPDGSIYMSMKTVERTRDKLICEFKITDTGIGMSEDFVKNKLFTPFVQADTSARSSYMGTGLGMPIVKDIVEKMGGSICVESELGVGSSFTVELPFMIDPDGRPEAEEERGGYSIMHTKLLLAEDNILNAEIAEELLKEKGASVVIAENGEKAVELFSGSPAGSFDAILMDMMMPVMDGLTATKKIRELDRPDAKTIPIIAMTANAFAEDAQRCMGAGMNAHIAKPLEMDKMEKTICEQISAAADRA